MLIYSIVDIVWKRWIEFLRLLFGCPTAKFGSLSSDSLTHSMLISAFQLISTQWSMAEF